MSASVESPRLDQMFPSAVELEDVDLHTAIAAAWSDIIERSAFDGPDDVPESLHIPERSLLVHTNEVIALALWMIGWSREVFGLEVGKDVVLGAAILHDMDKMLAYEKTETGEYRYAPNFDVLRDHGRIGAEISREHGVPQEITELVRLHSPFGDHDGLPGDANATILYYADLAAADLAAVQVARNPVHRRAKMVLRDSGRSPR